MSDLRQALWNADAVLDRPAISRSEGLKTLSTFRKKLLKGEFAESYEDVGVATSTGLDAETEARVGARAYALEVDESRGFDPHESGPISQTLSVRGAKAIWDLYGSFAGSIRVVEQATAASRASTVKSRSRALVIFAALTIGGLVESHTIGLPGVSTVLYLGLIPAFVNIYKNFKSATELEEGKDFAAFLLQFPEILKKIEAGDREAWIYFGDRFTVTKDLVESLEKNPGMSPLVLAKAQDARTGPPVRRIFSSEKPVEILMDLLLTADPETGEPILVIGGREMREIRRYPRRPRRARQPEVAVAREREAPWLPGMVPVPIPVPAGGRRH